MIHIKKKIVQEYAAVSLDNNFSYHDFVKLPKNYDKKIFHFVCKKLNHIPDCIGNVNFQEFVEFLAQDDQQFYAKGLVKCNYFSQFTKHKVINLEDFKCPKITKLTGAEYTASNVCHFLMHRTIENCALHKASKYANWIKYNSINLKF